MSKREYAREERETIILLNRADMDEGFFRISTSDHGDARKILRRLGPGFKDKLECVEYGESGRPVAYNIKVPIGRLARSSFCLRPVRSTAPPRKPGGNK